jgi:signal transduction histidine kinase
MVAWVITLHLVLLPVLYFGVGYVISRSHEDLFIENARTFARVMADEFELGAAMESTSRTEDLLDVAIIHGDGRYAELVQGATIVRSKLSSPNIKVPRHTDLHFDEDGDGVYFVVLPIVHGGRDAELRLGFDEQPILDRIHMAQSHLRLILGSYFCIVMLITVVLSNRLSRPVQRLRGVSRAIASGDYAQPMQVASGIRELTDLTSDLEAMRSELVGVNQRLQKQIQEKVASELQRDELQRQLLHKQRLETVGTLAGGVAHEFNNVLVPIILFTDMALRDLPDDSATRADLERVLAAARRAKDVVRKILTFSRELGDSKLMPTDLRTVLAEGHNLISALGPPNIEIRSHIDEAVPLVNADPALILQILMNLCTNAFEAMLGTNGVLTIGLHVVGGGQVEFWVGDTGHGMSSTTVERIFEPFFTTRSVGRGTGLGLSVAHGIVQSFGGVIKVESEEGKGATFRVTFPAYKPPEPEQEQDHEQERESADAEQ